MARIALLALAWLVMAVPALAQDEAAAKLSGYRLGKFFTTASMIATDLVVIDSLVTEMDFAKLTDENYQSGQVTDEELAQANLGLAYVIWRCQFMLLPACESALAEDAFQDPVLAELKEPTQKVLSALLADCNTFVDNADYVKLVTFQQALKDGAYADQLYVMAEQAKALAGDTE